jgi:DNA-binding MarR family transcriptional regulator
MKEFLDEKDIQRRIWVNWFHTVEMINKYADTKLKKVKGLSFQQFLVLVVMNAMGDTANATEMAKRLDKNTNTLSTILDRMEEKGLVKKSRDTKDRRLVWAVMTEKGKEKLTATKKLAIEIFDKLSECFSAEETKTFDTQIQKLMKQTNNELNPPKKTRKRRIKKF